MSSEGRGHDVLFLSFVVFSFFVFRFSFIVFLGRRLSDAVVEGREERGGVAKEGSGGGGDARPALRSCTSDEGRNLHRLCSHVFPDSKPRTRHLVGSSPPLAFGWE